MQDEPRTSLVIGARLMAGWACAAVAVLNLSMGLEPGSYLIFHLVLLVGGLLLLGYGKLPRKPRPRGYGVTVALAALATGLAALPGTSTVCCLRDLDVRHGYPVTLLAWDPGQPRHFAPAHALAALVFWFLLGMMLLSLVTQMVPARRHAADEAAESGRAAGSGEPGDRGGDQPTHAEGRVAREGAVAPVADDENVGGLP
jgi:hypothetical protein